MGEQIERKGQREKPKDEQFHFKSKASERR